MARGTSLQAAALRIGRDLATAVVTGANELKKLMAYSIVEEEVILTPVDTGRARSNWLTSPGAPLRAVIEPYSPGEKLGRGETGNAAGALGLALAAVELTPPGMSIHITNSTPYIEDLNNGVSPQAPAGFVENAIDRGVSKVSGVGVFNPDGTPTRFKVKRRIGS